MQIHIYLLQINEIFPRRSFGPYRIFKQGQSQCEGETFGIYLIHTVKRSLLAALGAAIMHLIN